MLPNVYILNKWEALKSLIMRGIEERKLRKGIYIQDRQFVSLVIATFQSTLVNITGRSENSNSRFS